MTKGLKKARAPRQVGVSSEFFMHVGRAEDWVRGRG